MLISNSSAFHNAYKQRIPSPNYNAVKWRFVVLARVSGILRALEIDTLSPSANFNILVKADKQSNSGMTPPFKFFFNIPLTSLPSTSYYHPPLLGTFLSSSLPAVFPFLLHTALCFAHSCLTSHKPPPPVQSAALTEGRGAQLSRAQGWPPYSPPFLYSPLKQGAQASGIASFCFTLYKLFNA